MLLSMKVDALFSQLGLLGTLSLLLSGRKVDSDGNFIESLGRGLELILDTVTLGMTGKYVAKATNCQTKHVYTRSVTLDVIPLPEPTPASETEPINACSVFGDPHIVTFDKHNLHFSGECTYLLAMDC